MPSSLLMLARIDSHQSRASPLSRQTDPGKATFRSLCARGSTPKIRQYPSAALASRSESFAGKSERERRDYSFVAELSSLVPSASRISLVASDDEHRSRVRRIMRIAVETRDDEFKVDVPASEINAKPNAARKERCESGE